MDHELKQRLIGAVVITALAAIFVPMLFDDPVDNSGKAVSELTIPQAPASAAQGDVQNLPENKNQVLARPDVELSVTEENEGSSANPLEGTATKMPDGGHEDQAGTIDDTNIIAEENELSDGIGKNLSSQAEKKKLDTGEVPETLQSEDRQDNVISETQPIKEPEQAVKKAASKTTVSEKSKVKPDVYPEKIKPIAQATDDSVKKSSSKLVRYSIQAGSFNKKENAQVLVDKLRKQGMPVSIVEKGGYFRVKIGPGLDKSKVKEMKSKLDKQNIKGLLVSE